jgi:hypothetical protein
MGAAVRTPDLALPVVCVTLFRVVCLRFYTEFNSSVVRDSIVGVETRYVWTVRGSNPGGGEIFRTRVDRPWGLPRLLYNGYRVSFPGLKRPGRGVDHPSHLVPRLKKEQSYTSTPPLGLHGLFLVELYLFPAAERSS